MKTPLRAFYEASFSREPFLTLCDTIITNRKGRCKALTRNELDNHIRMIRQLYDVQEIQQSMFARAGREKGGAVRQAIIRNCLPPWSGSPACYFIRCHIWNRTPMDGTAAQVVYFTACQLAIAAYVPVPAGSFFCVAGKKPVQCLYRNGPASR